MITLSAKPLLEKIHSDLRTQVGRFQEKAGRAPHLTVVLVGDDPASVIYTQKKGKTAEALGFEHSTITFPSSTTPERVQAEIQRLNDDPKVDGILVQRPLPPTFREEDVVYWVTPNKDVDAFHPENTGRLHLGLPCFQPCTPSGVIELLKHYEIPLAGRVACVIGRSSIVGKPMAALLLNENATIIQCHSKTRDIPRLAREADILVVAAGKPGLIGADCVKPGACVVDVGIHRTSDGKVVGDVRFEEAAAKAGAITPVPGGVGPTTIAVLLKNTVRAAELSLKIR